MHISLLLANKATCWLTDIYLYHHSHLTHGSDSERRHRVCAGKRESIIRNVPRECLNARASESVNRGNSDRPSAPRTAPTPRTGNCPRENAVKVTATHVNNYLFFHAVRWKKRKKRSAFVQPWAPYSVLQQLQREKSGQNHIWNTAPPLHVITLFSWRSRRILREKQ